VTRFPVGRAARTGSGVPAANPVRRAAAGVIPYAVATPLAFVSPYLTLGICAALDVYYALPRATGHR
jgi:hypothetical protein